MPYDEIAVSEQVLDYGLPPAPTLVQPGQSVPIARWTHGDCGAVLHLRRLPDGERDMDLVVFVLVAGHWKPASAYQGLKQRALLLAPQSAGPGRAGSGRAGGRDAEAGPLRLLWTTMHKPYAPDRSRTLWISEYLAEPGVDSVRLDYPDGSTTMPVRFPGVVLVGFTDAEPVLTPVAIRERVPE